MNSLQELSKMARTAKQHMDNWREEEKDIKMDFEYTASLLINTCNLNEHEKIIATMIINHGITAGQQVYRHQLQKKKASE
jgi:hypothetical protein